MHVTRHDAPRQPRVRRADTMRGNAQSPVRSTMTTQDANPQPANEPRPLHERWPSALGYPMQMAALSTIVALAVAHVVVRLLPGIVGWFFDLIVWAAFFKYAFEVLRWSANGRDEAPEISLTVSDDLGRYAVLLLLVIEVALVLIAMWWGALPALLIGIVLMFAMPAMRSEEHTSE